MKGYCLENSESWIWRIYAQLIYNLIVSDPFLTEIDPGGIRSFYHRDFGEKWVRDYKVIIRHVYAGSMTRKFLRGADSHRGFGEKMVRRI